MHQTSLDTAITTADLVHTLDCLAEDPKCTLRDLLASTGQVATTLGVCWMVHLFI